MEEFWVVLIDVRDGQDVEKVAETVTSLALGLDLVVNKVGKRTISVGRSIGYKFDLVLLIDATYPGGLTEMTRQVNELSEVLAMHSIFYGVVDTSKVEEVSLP